MDDKTIIILDDFINQDQFDPFNKAIESSDFAGVEYFGRFYPGVAPSNDMIDSIVTETIEKRLQLTEDSVSIKLSMLRLELESDEPTSWIHADTICGSQYALVGYMNDSPLKMGGTAFWKHSICGESNTEFKDNDLVGMFLVKDSHSDQSWEITGMAGYKKNRVVIYHSDRFHSRFPRKSFGTTKEDGRLIYVCFFDIN